MTWPPPPIGSRPAEPAPVAPVERTRDAERRRERDPGEQQRRRQHDDGSEARPGPDADGHIDVLA